MRFVCRDRDRQAPGRFFQFGHWCWMPVGQRSRFFGLFIAVLLRSVLSCLDNTVLCTTRTVGHNMSVIFAKGVSVARLGKRVTPCRN